MGFIYEGYGQITHIFQIPGPGSPAMVVYGINDIPAASPDDVAGAAVSAWTIASGMQTMMDASASLVQTNYLRKRGGNLEAGVDLTIQAGAQGANAASPQVAGLFQKKTGFAGRNRRGRLYFPAVLDPGETGTFIAPATTNYQAAADLLLSSLTSQTCPMVLLHTDPSDPPTAVTELVFQNVAATQRRRIR